MSAGYHCPNCGTWLVGYFRNCPACSKSIDVEDGGTNLKEEMSKPREDWLVDEIHELDDEIERKMRMKKGLEDQLDELRKGKPQ